MVSNHFFPAEAIQFIFVTEKKSSVANSSGSDLSVGILQNKLILRNFLRNLERFRMVFECILNAF